MLKFKCKNCGIAGPAACSKDLPFIHCAWYPDGKGLIHGCLYCRHCGTVHDTIGSLLGPIKMLFGSIPSKVLIRYDTLTFNKLLRINTPEFRVFYTPPDQIILAMIEDGRFEDSTYPEDLYATEDFLLQCLQDENEWVRKASEMALEYSRRRPAQEQ